MYLQMPQTEHTQTKLLELAELDRFWSTGD